MKPETSPLRRRSVANHALQSDHTELLAPPLSIGALCRNALTSSYAEVLDVLRSSQQRTSQQSLTYEAMRTKAGLQRLASIWKLYLPLHIVVITTHLICGTYTVQDWFFSVTLGASVAVFMNWLVHYKIDQMSDGAIVPGGTALQAIIFSLTISDVVYRTPSIESVLVQHRFFLSAAIPVFLLYSIAGYIPSRLYNYVLAPSFFFWWVAFHWTVGFLRPAALMFGVILVLFACYIHNILDETEFKSFVAISELNDERHFLQETKSTLNGMLASLFDASCICADNGEVNSCTPHLQELLVGPRGGPISNLCSFAFTDVERARLLGFLQNAAKNAVHRAETIQVSFRSPLLAFQGGDTLSLAEGATIGVSLYAIILPSRTAEPSSGLFVGFQLQADAETKLQPIPRNSYSRKVADAPESHFVTASEGMLPEEPDSDASSMTSSVSSDTSHTSQRMGKPLPELARIDVEVDITSLTVLALRMSFSPQSSLSESGKLSRLRDWIPDFMRLPFLEWFQSEVNRQFAEMEDRRPVSVGPVLWQWPVKASSDQPLAFEAERASLQLCVPDNDSSDSDELSSNVHALLHLQDLAQTSARHVASIRRKRMRTQRMSPLPAINENHDTNAGVRQTSVPAFEMRSQGPD